MSDQADADVLIVGGGPVGMGLSIELARRGITSVVVERYPEPQPVPKGQNMTQRTGEHFRVWGVSKEIRAAAPIPHDYPSAGITAYGSLMSGYAYDWFSRAEVRPYYAADHERMPQYDTENVLRRRAATFNNITTLYGWEGVSVEQDESSVRVTVRNRETEEQRLLTGRYAVGCDGSRSMVRDAVGIEQEVDPHDKLMVLLVFDSPQLHELLEDRFARKCYFNVLKPEIEGYWQFFGRVELGKSFFFHAPVPPDTTRDNFDFAAYLQESVGTPFDLTLTYTGFWDLRIAVAKNYRKGRVFIAGDAAHSHPPYGGYGINTGFEDARNLGWKLAAVLHGWAGDGLLDSYSAERQPVFASTAQDFIGRMIREDAAFLSEYDPAKDKDAFEAEWHRREADGNDAVVNFLPHYSGSPVVWGEPGAVTNATGNHTFEAKAGQHLAPRTLSNGQSVYDELSDDLTLLALGLDDEVVKAFSRVAEHRGLPLTVVQDPGGGELDDYGAPGVLVRPDHFVAWAGQPNANEAEQILTRAVGA